MGDETDFDDLRADLTSAFKQAETGNEEQTETPPSESAAPEGERRARDSSGRFAPEVPAQDKVIQDGEQSKKPEGEQQQVEGEQKQVAEQTAKPPSKIDRAPASWRAEEREHWNEVKPEVRAAIHRREQEVDAVLRNSAESRRFTQAFAEVIKPYEGMIVSEGSNALAAVQNMMQTAALFRYGQPQQKAQAVAQLVQQFGIDIEMLDAALTQNIGKGQNLAPQIQQIIQRELAPIKQQLAPQARHPANDASVQQEFDAFINDPENEFINDVGPLMASILDDAARRNELMSLQDAYKRATLAHPEVSKILERRKGAQSAAQLNAAALRAKNAAASVSGDGAPTRSDSQVEDDGSIRSAMMASISELSKANRL